MDTTQQSLPRQIFEELKRRRVIRVATIYVLALWPIIQIVDILSPALGLPPTAMRYLLIMFVAGLPVALILSWLYDLNKGGIVRTTDPDGRPDHPLISRSAEITVISVLIMSIAVLFFLQSTLDLEEGDTPQVAATADTHSIAVLPFVSFSEAREDELFSDGLTEELLNVLSQIKYLRVIARTTSFAYKGVNRNIQEIGQELNVATILEGSVRRNDVENTIRVTAQLIDIASGTHLWSNSFDREFRDIFKIQDEIAAAVVNQLNLTLGQEETRRIQSRETASTDAMVAYGMGSSSMSRRTLPSLKDAERYFQEAIAADSNYTAAYAELANAYALQADQLPKESERYLRMAQTQVDSALALDADNGAAWAAQGLIHMIRMKTDPEQKEDARAALNKAIALNPSLAMANMWYASLMDDQAEQHRYLARAFELDPRSPVAGLNLANDLLDQGRDSEAMETIGRIVEADPNFPGSYGFFGRVNESRGRLGEAIRNYQTMYDLKPENNTAAKLTQLWIDIGDFQRADEWLRRAESGLPPESLSRTTWLRISSYIARGDRERAEGLIHALRAETPVTMDEHIDSAHADYFLGDYQAAANTYEVLQEGFDKPMHDQVFQLLELDVAMAYAYRQLGRENDATRLLERAEEKIAELMANNLRIEPELWFFLAQVHSIRGETNLALINLQRAVDEGFRQHWRPLVEPSLTALATEPAFTAMMQGLATRMDLIREQIAFDNAFDEGWQI